MELIATLSKKVEGRLAAKIKILYSMTTGNILVFEGRWLGFPRQSKRLKSQNVSLYQCSTSVNIRANFYFRQRCPGHLICQYHTRLLPPPIKYSVLDSGDYH